ncbi:MAG: acyl-ACP--UDP-N-acetylglucosamine O-acyltransferase [Pyrinomonadaceae bacterium]|nr:acyl-ACP--UDP-N-acetylglucosamine O-acyltransferase [Pyrinomonadaceae bacterium]
MTSPTIHSTAVVSSEANLGGGVSLGPFVVIEGNAEIGEGTSIGAHSVVHSNTKIGKHNRIHSHVILGDDPQHLSFKDETSYLEIGDENTIREMFTAHRSMYEGGKTVIGSSCYLMSNSHVGHDSIVEDEVIVTSNVALGGHVEVGRKAVIGGAAGVHQFVRIGSLAMVGAHTYLRQDVLPFSMISGEPARHYRLNSVGLRRSGVKGPEYRALEKAFRLVREKKGLDEVPITDQVEHLKEWLSKDSKRGLSKFVRSG